MTSVLLISLYNFLLYESFFRFFIINEMQKSYLFPSFSLACFYRIIETNSRNKSDDLIQGVQRASR